MCGIFGLIEKNGIHPDVLARMGSLIRHRGPDGEGFVLINSADSTALALGGSDTPIDAFSVSTNSKALGMIERAIGGLWNVGFGHRRLSIVDLSALGHQPMASTDGSLWITFNGEIYNHIELRAELEALGHCFTSHSDTEVILCAYRQWGVGCLSRFNGMWAFALHDLKLGKIFLARDRFGVKPLYFWRNGGSFAFASEIKAFLAHPDFSVRPSKTNLQSYLKDGPSEWDSATVFGGVHQLQASSYVLATPQDFLEGRFTAVRWWTVEPNSGLEEFDPSVADRLSDQYYELLRSAVELRLRADVPVGSALSGGLDSSSVVYLIAQRIKDAGESRSQETFSSVYRGLGTQHCDESPFIETVGRLLNVHMNTIEPRPEDVPEEHARMIWCMDVPPESTCMSGWHTFKLVNSRGIKVTLDGQGADEQLAGYLSYLAIALAPSGLASVLQLSKLTRLHPRRVAIGAVAGAMISRLASSTPVRRLFSGRRARVLSQLSGGLNNALWQDCHTGLSNLIHYADRTSMAFGVESRMPFLDYRLAEFLFSVPAAYKIHDGWTKHLARQAFTKRLPASIVWRRDKMGWPIPEEVWERGPLSSWFKRPRAAASRMASLGLEAEFSQALNSPSITRRVRALNLEAWTRTFLEGEWRALA